MNLPKTRGEDSPTTYRVAPEVKWTVETQGLLLVVDGQGKTHWLPYPQAAVWDLISRGRPAPKVLMMTSHIASLDLERAEKLILESLEEWTRLGLLTKVQGTTTGD